MRTPPGSCAWRRVPAGQPAEGARGRGGQPPSARHDTARQRGGGSMEGAVVQQGSGQRWPALRACHHPRHGRRGAVVPCCAETCQPWPSTSQTTAGSRCRWLAPPPSWNCRNFKHVCCTHGQQRQQRACPSPPLPPPPHTHTRFTRRVRVDHDTTQAHNASGKDTTQRCQPRPASTARAPARCTLACARAPAGLPPRP